MESSKDNKFSICVVIPAYNIAEFVGRAIDSVLTQTHKPDEIIVVDDGSGDSTAEVIKSYGTKVRYIYQENAGLSAARNTGIKAAGSEWIALLDGDDNWLPQFLQLHLGVIQQNPNLMWSTGNYITYSYADDRKAPYFTQSQIQKLLGRNNYFESYLHAYTLGTTNPPSTMLIKSQVFDDAGLFQHGLRFAEDWDMWMRIAYRWPKIGYVSEPISVYYLDRPDSLMYGTANTEKIKTNCELIDRHLKLSAEYGKNEQFQKCATFMLRRWIRGMLFHNLPDDIRDILMRYDSLLPNYYKMFMKLLITFPKTTANICHLISRIIRCFNLRRRVVRRPQQ